MELTIKEENNFKYFEEGSGKTLLLLHGLFGAMSNFSEMIKHFSSTYRVVFPVLPIYGDVPANSSVSALVDYVRAFVEWKGYSSVSLVGNSLGGHVALIYALRHSAEVDTITLTGSSGLFENTMGNTFPKRGDRDFIRKKTEGTFYDKSLATEEMVDDLFDIVNDNQKLLCILTAAKSAIRENLSEHLHKLSHPTCLIWGANDEITPPFVAEEFHSALPNSELHFIDKCGHAPMMEQAALFNEQLDQFLVTHLENKQ